MAKRGRRDREKERYWRRMLGLWWRSGLTGREFCVEHGLSEPSFYAWRREIARRDEEVRQVSMATRSVERKQNAAAVPAFLEVVVDGTTPTAIEVVVANGRLVRVRPGFDAGTLRQVLEEPAC